MGQFSIKEIEQLTGIRAHTLRIWEQRYDLPKPKRSGGNVRFYDDEDLRLLLNISVLNRNGLKISEITKLTEKEIGARVDLLASSEGGMSVQIHAMLSAMLDLDESRFNRVLTSCILQSGLERTMMEVVFPFMSKIGLLWQTGSLNTAYEHFMSALLRQKLIVAIDGQDEKLLLAPKNFLLFLPEGEYHELGLLFGHYLIKSAGHRVLYLGANMPLDNLESIGQHFSPDYILTSLTSALPIFNQTDFTAQLSQKFPSAVILATGEQLLNATHEKTIHYICSPDDLKKFL